MIDCGSQCWLCDLPVRFDTYKNCEHACSYCFVKRARRDISNVEALDSASGLLRFINNNRKGRLSWCDWDIPLHWGGKSDPFQPAERECKESYKALQILKETQYPFVVSTKGRLIAEKEYLDLIEKCKCVVQISMACASYDKIEQGAPPFKERIEIARKVASRGIRVNARIQPYFVQHKKEILKSLELMADAGVYGVIVEGMKFQHKIKGLVKIGADFCYPKKVLESDFRQIKKRCHELGMKFYCGENRLRSMGDSLTCCGIDGLEGFNPNTYNLNHMLNGDLQEAKEGMKKVGSAECFSTLFQTTKGWRRSKNTSFEEMMKIFYAERKEAIDKAMGVK